MKHTEKYALPQIELDDYYDIDVFNYGYRKIDEELKNVNESLDNMEKKSFVSITDFGAKAEINFDNTELIQRAIDFACDNKIPLYLPSGIYETKGTLNITKPIHFFGSGWSETIIKYLGNGICINIEGQGTPSTKDWVKYSTFRDFSISAKENLELNERFSRVGIKICRCVISEFKNIKISWFAECGILFEGREDDPVTRGNCCYNNHFYRVETYKCGNGIIVNARISDTYFVEVDSSYIDGHAYLFKDMAHETYNVNITRNTLVKVKTGIEIRDVGVFNLLIDNNYIEHFSEYGIYYNCPTEFCDYGKIVGNALFYNQEVNVGEAIGIKTDGGRMLDISNNCFYNNAKTDIEITNRSTKCYEHGNNVRRRDLIKILAPSTVSYYYKYDYSQNYTQFDRGVGTRMGDVIVEAPWSGFVCKSPDGTAYRLRVDNAGQLVIESIN